MGLWPARSFTADYSGSYVVNSQPPHTVLDLDMDKALVRKRQPLALDLNGTTKGYGVDQLAKVLPRFGITSALVGIDGELRV